MEAERAATQGVLIDVGGDAGALVIYADEALLGREVEIARTGEASRVHADVLERSVASGSVFAAVFPSLAEGDYDIWLGGQSRAGTARIVAGDVTRVDLDSRRRVSS